MIDRELLKLALEAIEKPNLILCMHAIESIKCELVKPEQEPDANPDLYSIAGRLALELECLLLDTKDISIVSKWWDSAHEALDQWQKFHFRACAALDSSTHSADSAETFGKPDIGLVDPCRQCMRGGVCCNRKCGRLQLPVDHPYRNQAFALAQTEQTSRKYQPEFRYITTPKREWVSLTEDDLDEINGSPMRLEHSGLTEFAHAIEEACREKNG